MFGLSFESSSRGLILAAVVTFCGAWLPIEASAQEPPGGTPPPEGDQTPNVSRGYYSTQPTDVTIVLVDYQDNVEFRKDNMEFRPGSRIVANDESGPCHFEVAIAPAQASELTSTGRTTMRVPALCGSLMLVYFDEANMIDPESVRSGKPPTLDRAVQEFTFPLWLEVESATYYSPSLKPVHWSDPAPATGQPSLFVNTGSEGWNWFREGLLSAGALLLLALGVAALAARRLRHGHR